MNITLQTIADELGVTRATVSRALRNSPEIAPATRDKIQKTAKALNYRPNPFVNTLMESVRAGKAPPDTLHIAVVEGWPRDFSNDPFKMNQDFVLGICGRASDHNVKVDRISLHRGGMTPKRAFSVIKNRGIKGLIFLPFPKFGHDLGRSEQLLGDFAMAAIGHTLKTPRLFRAVSDQFQNAELALVNMARLGWKRIGLLQTEDYERRVNHRQLGACLALSAELGIDFVRPLIVPDQLKQEEQRNLAISWLKKEKPKAILSHGDEGLRLLMNAQGQMPNGLGYAAIGRLESYPGMAGVDQRHKEVGAAAVDIVMAQFHRNERGLPALARTSMIEGMWVDGGTLGRYAFAI